MRQSLQYMVTLASFSVLNIPDLCLRTPFLFPHRWPPHPGENMKGSSLSVYMVRIPLDTQVEPFAQAL